MPNNIDLQKLQMHKDNKKLETIDTVAHTHTHTGTF